ncbi:TatD family hydrolase [Paludibacter sp.]|uniref:TatD family hydrolase n=1 Tax=Paludibacter sp. TaxID=1898105 RepID=UPI00135390B8|nr:TatD family hydrolase [Paludibacter sp.]MTK53965.1 TatD family deoxyribonuclease [Paludibacter sp.]
MLIDTHSHIYLSEFDEDRAEVVNRAKAAGVAHIILPNVDKETLEPMWALEATDTKFFSATIGLHPTSVDAEYKKELEWVKNKLARRPYCAIGEVGIDLYWDKTFREEQIIAFEQQLQWAIDYDLPVIIHQRDAFEDTIACVEKYNCSKLRGVFHSFGGSLEEAQRILSLGGFYLGINGVVTFKNSKLSHVLEQLSPEYLVLETDAPYLTPAPHRGKRNESAYVRLVAQKLAEIYQQPVNEIIEITGKNATKLFSL